MGDTNSRMCGGNKAADDELTIDFRHVFQEYHLQDVCPELPKFTYKFKPEPDTLVVDPSRRRAHTDRILTNIRPEAQGFFMQWRDYKRVSKYDLLHSDHSAVEASLDISTIPKKFYDSIQAFAT